MPVPVLQIKLTAVDAAPLGEAGREPHPARLI
jgi:hypothetical protein